MTEVFLDPTAELNPAAKALLPRLQSLKGKNRWSVGYQQTTG